MAPIKPPKKKLSEIRKEPGKTNAYKYPKVAKKDFAGPDNTFPINSRKRAKAALSYAHDAANPSAVRAKVHKKYPTLGGKKK